MLLERKLLSNATGEGLPLQQLKNSTYLNNHWPESTKTCTNSQMPCYICSDIIVTEFNLQLLVKQGCKKEDKNPPASWTLTHIFDILKC